MVCSGEMSDTRKWGGSAGHDLLRGQCASIQTLAQAYANFYGAVADYNRAQFRLYRALGHPAHFISGYDSACLLTPIPRGR